MSGCVRSFKRMPSEEHILVVCSVQLEYMLSQKRIYSTRQWKFQQRCGSYNYVRGWISTTLGLFSLWTVDLIAFSRKRQQYGLNRLERLYLLGIRRRPESKASYQESLVCCAMYEKSSWRKHSKQNWWRGSRSNSLSCCSGILVSM